MRVRRTHLSGFRHQAFCRARKREGAEAPSLLAELEVVSYLATLAAPPLASILAWAAARRAMGTRYGEQDT